MSLDHLAYAADLREPAETERAAAAAVAQFGRLASLVNNAGATKRAAFSPWSKADWRD